MNQTLWQQVRIESDYGNFGRPIKHELGHHLTTMIDLSKTLCDVQLSRLAPSFLGLIGESAVLENPQLCRECRNVVAEENGLRENS